MHLEVKRFDTCVFKIWFIFFANFPKSLKGGILKKEHAATNNLKINKTCRTMILFVQ